MKDGELEQSYATLGVAPGISREALKKVYLQQSYSLIRAGAPEAERERLRVAHDALVAHLEAAELQQPTASTAQTRILPGQLQVEQPVAGVGPALQEPEFGRYDLRSFDSAFVNAIAPPLVALLAVGLQKSMLGFLLTGFHVWIHEFGHATVAWLTGFRALPLPIGWTNMVPEKSLFVYFGLLLLFGMLFVAGARERKPAAMVAAVLLALLQALLTWRLPDETARMWRIFAGCGGEFYLPTAMAVLFYFQLPEKFRWGACRYLFLFVGTASFAESYVFWKTIKRGEAGIPYGSMVNGEEDAGGDMNILHDDFGWSQHDIIYRYNHLGDACLVALVVIYAFFALRLNKVLARLMERMR